MKQNFLLRIGSVITPPYLRGSKIAHRALCIVNRASLILLVMLMSVNMWGADTYERLTSIANIDESAQYVLGIDGTGFHYEGTSSWGKTALPSAQTPLYYTLKKAADEQSFTAKTEINKTTYYLQIPTSNTFGMATSTGTNTDLIIGTTYDAGDGKDYAVTNKSTTTRHLRRNGTSGLRSYASTTGAIAFFYKVVIEEEKTLSSIAISGTPNKTTYEAGESFEYAGLTATGTYDDSSTEDITSSVDWSSSVEPLTQGTTSITVTATQGNVFGNKTISGLNVTPALGDKLTRESTGITSGSTSYTAWTDKTGSQGVAVYAGKSAGSNNAIQLNKTSPNGIVSTTSAGLIKKVKVDWNTNTSDGRYITIYGSNTAYTGSADVYDTEKQGTSLGTIKNGTNTELIITGDYAYVGVKANDPLYLNYITFVWETALVFDLNGGSGTKPNSITSFPATLPVSTSFTKSGYRPNGWNTQADGNGTHYADGASFSAPEASVKLYVEWMPVYTVTYNGNSNTSGSVPSDINSPYNENSSVTVLGNTGNLERTGYTWSGWNGNTSGTGTEYVVGNSFTITSNTTLYAKWTANNYEVTFNKNSEEAGGSMEPQPFAFDEQKALTENKFTAPAHKHFVGWATTPDGAKVYNDGASYKMSTEGATLYAVWAYNQTTITLDKQNGSSSSIVIATYGSAMPSAGAVPTKTGYDFNGYYTGQNGTGTQYYNSTNTSVQNWDKDDATTTLYAYWTPKNITITLNANGHSDADGSFTIVYGTKVATAFTAVIPHTGYSVRGYYTTQAGGGAIVINPDGTLGNSMNNWIDADGNWIKATNETLHACYTPDKHNVSWVVSGNPWTGKGGSTKADYDSRVANVPTTVPTTSDCDFTKVFVGWTANEIDGTTDIIPSDLFTDAAGAPIIKGDATYYAVFALPDESATEYAKGTLADLQTGKKVILVHSDKAVSSVSSTADYLDAVSVSVVSSKITTSDASIIWNVTKDGNNYKFDQGNSKKLNVNSDGLYANTTDGSFIISTRSSSYELKDALNFEYIDYWSTGFTNYSSSHNDNCIDFYLPATTYSEYATTCVPCTNRITISKGEEVEHGSYSLSKTGDVCLSNIPGGTYSVTVTATPDEHYHLATVITSSGTAGEVINNTCVVSGITANTTLTAVFEEDPKVTVTWHKGATTETTSNIYVGTLYSGIAEFAPTVADDAAGDCANKFMGWATEPINGSEGVDESDVVWVTDEYVIDDTHKDIYAVFATKEGTGGDFTLVSGVSQLGEGEAYIGSYIKYNSAWNYYVATSAGDIAKTTLSNNVLTPTEAMLKLKFVSTGTANQYYLKDASGKYLHASNTGVNPTLSETACAWTFSGESSTMGMKSSLGSNVYLCAYSSGNTGKLKTYSSEDGNSKICVYLSSAIYSNYITQCCTTPDNPLEITNTDLTVKTGKTLQLNTTEGNGNTKEWKSLNSAVATVTSEGVVTPVSTGKATITVSQEAKDGYCAQSDEVEIEVIASNEFSIAFAAADGGTTEAKVNGAPTNKATTGTTVTITATPTDDYNFTGWTVNAGGVTLADASNATTTFVMGEADVEITPSFALKQFTVTLNAGTGDIETTSYTKDVHTFINLPVAAHCQPDIWVFQGWSETNVEEVSSNCPTLVDNNYEITKDVTLYAIYKKADGGEKTIGYKISYQVDNTTYYASSGVSSKKMSVDKNADNAVIFGMTTTSGQSKLYQVDENGDAKAGTYIYLDSNNDLAQGTEGSANGYLWTISMTGTHSIISVKKNARCIAGRTGNAGANVVNASVANVDSPEGAGGNYFYHITLIPVVKGAASYCTSPECVSLTWVNEMLDADPVVTYPADGKIVLPTQTPASCAPGLYSFVGWTATNWPGYKQSDQGTITAETAAPEHATTYYAEFVNTAGKRYRTTCPETMYAITYKANGGEGEDYIQYSENKTNVTSYNGSAFSKTACSLYQWNTAADGTGNAYKPNATIFSLEDIVGDETTGTLYAQWTGDLSVIGNVNLTSGKGITVYTTAAAGNLITISCPAIDMVHHIRYKFLDSENNEVNTLKLCNNGTENFNQLTNIATDGVVGEYEQTFSICYTPTECNQSATYTLLLEGVDQGGNTIFNSCSLTVTVRSLPEQFVIAIKKDKQWYAVPNVLATSSSDPIPAAIEVNVNDNANPTYVIPDEKKSQILFQAASHPTGSITWRRGAIRLQRANAESYGFITATHTDNTSFYMPNNNADDQQLYLTSTDCNKYKVTLDPALYDNNIPTRWMSVYDGKIGWYNTQACDVYFLPINEYVVIRENLTDGKIGTMCQAKKIVAVKGGTLYQPNYEENNYLEFIEVTLPVAAGMPLIYQADGTNDGKLAVMYGAEDAVTAALTEGTRGMVGYIGEDKLDVPNYSESNQNYVFQNNKLLRANQNYLINDRAYVSIDAVHALEPIVEEPIAAPRRRLVMDVESRTTPTGWDDVLKADNIQKLIINDKMYILRAGKMYDATGKFVK